MPSEKKEEETLILPRLLRRALFESLKQHLKLEWKIKGEYLSCCEVQFEANSGMRFLDIEALAFTVYLQDCYKISPFIKHY